MVYMEKETTCREYNIDAMGIRRRKPQRDKRREVSLHCGTCMVGGADRLDLPVLRKLFGWVCVCGCVVGFCKPPSKSSPASDHVGLYHGSKAAKLRARLSIFSENTAHGLIYIASVMMCHICCACIGHWKYRVQTGGLHRIYICCILSDCCQ